MKTLKLKELAKVYGQHVAEDGTKIYMTEHAVVRGLLYGNKNIKKLLLWA